MATWTLDDLATLKAAIAKGIRSVEYSDKKITYASLDEMLKIMRLMEQELGLKSKGARLFAEADKGLK